MTLLLSSWHQTSPQSYDSLCRKRIRFTIVYLVYLESISWLDLCIQGPVGWAIPYRNFSPSVADWREIWEWVGHAQGCTDLFMWQTPIPVLQYGKLWSSSIIILKNHEIFITPLHQARSA